MTLHPIHAAELILRFEGAALEAESMGGYLDAECIRRNATGLIEAIEKVEEQAPGYAADCIRAMRKQS